MKNKLSHQPTMLFLLFALVGFLPGIAKGAPEFLSNKESSFLWGSIGLAYLFIGLAILWFCIQTWIRLKKLQQELKDLQ